MKTPPFKIYVFNVTNPSAFSSGEAPLPVLQEVGPFVYEAAHERVIERWGGPTTQEEITFRYIT